jgi:chaperonin GroEL
MYSSRELTGTPHLKTGATMASTKFSGGWQRPGVVFQPAVFKGMREGIQQIVSALRPTLGPYPRVVLVDGGPGNREHPEILDDGATIARRVIQIPNREADVGAMYIRHILWRLHEEVGDGIVIAALIFKAVYEGGLRYVAAGGNPMLLRRHLEEGARLIVETLETSSFSLSGKEQLTRLAETICHDPPLSALLGEIFDIIGEYGRLEIRTGKGRSLEREYVEGMYWSGGILSRLFLTDKRLCRTRLEDAALLITDLEIDDPRELVIPVGLAAQAGFKSMVIVCESLSEMATAFLVQNRKQIHAIGVQTPTVDRRAALQDMSILTGGRPFLKATRDSLHRARREDLGQARRVWANREHFGVVGGKGDPRRLREHLATLRAAFAKAEDRTKELALQQRIGKLLGGFAVLYVGGITETEIDLRKDLAARTANAMRGAMREGVLPGGGVALRTCRPLLHVRRADAGSSEERAAYEILLCAVEAPFVALLENAGLEAGAVAAEIDAVGPGCGFDVTTGEVVDMVEAGIFDAAAVLKAAVRSAVNGAALALTTDVVVHRKAPPTEYET